MTIHEQLKHRKRPARTVTIDGADPLHVRDLTLAELREIDRRAEELPPGTEREIRRFELMALYSLAEPDGAPAFPERTAADLETVGLLTAAELRAVAEASVPTRADAKND